MVVKNGDESHGTIGKKVNKSKPSKWTNREFFKSQNQWNLWKTQSLQFGSTTKHISSK